MTKQQLIFETETDIHEELADYLDTNKFIQYMKKIGEVESNETEYSSMVYKLCRNACAWVLSNLKDTMYIFDIKIGEGTFMGQDHSWLIIGDYIVDLTLSQFINAPDLAIIKQDKSKEIGYMLNKEYTPFQWKRLIQNE